MSFSFSPAPGPFDNRRCTTPRRSEQVSTQNIRRRWYYLAPSVLRCPTCTGYGWGRNIGSWLVGSRLACFAIPYLPRPTIDPKEAASKRARNVPVSSLDFVLFYGVNVTRQVTRSRRRAFLPLRLFLGSSTNLPRNWPKRTTQISRRSGARMRFPIVL